MRKKVILHGPARYADELSRLDPPCGIIHVRTLEQGLREAQRHSVTAAILIDGGAGEMDCAEAVCRYLRLTPCARLIVVSTGEKRNLRLLDYGIHDLFTPPFSWPEVLHSLKRAFARLDLEQERNSEEADFTKRGAAGLEGESEVFRSALSKIRTAAPSGVPVLLLGESGTGKEAAARAIHALSGRGKGPFVPINCGAIPCELFEAEIYGFEKGAFTGAESCRKGKIELADGGTLFLDEIGDLDLRSQVKFLRSLQDKTIERIGGREQIPVDVRIIAATNRDLWRMVKEGRFREDLYFRLCVVSVEMPPLRERGDDVVLLAARLAERFSKEFGKRLPAFSPESMKALKSHSWQGNVRELENRVKRALILAKGEVISPEDLGLRQCQDAAGRREHLAEARDAFSKTYLMEVLLKNCGAVSKSAAEIGISRQYMTRLISKYKLRHAWSRQ